MRLISNRFGSNKKWFLFREIESVVELCSDKSYWIIKKMLKAANIIKDVIFIFDYCLPDSIR